MNETTTDNGSHSCDGMTVFQSLSAETCTAFEDLVFKYVRGVFSDINMADKVKDVLIDMAFSIQSWKKNEKSGTLKSKTYSVNGSGPILPWKYFMGVTLSQQGHSSRMKRIVLVGVYERSNTSNVCYKYWHLLLAWTSKHTFMMNQIAWNYND